MTYIKTESDEYINGKYVTKVSVGKDTGKPEYEVRIYTEIGYTVYMTFDNKNEADLCANSLMSTLAQDTVYFCKAHHDTIIYNPNTIVDYYKNLLICDCVDCECEEK